MNNPSRVSPPSQTGVWTLDWADVHLGLRIPYPRLAEFLSALLGLTLTPAPDSLRGPVDVAIEIAPAQGFIVTSGSARYELLNLADLWLRVLTLIGSLLLEKTRQLIVHAGAIQTEAGALLFCGSSYVGKSTLGFQAWQAGLTLLGDDRLVFHPENARVSAFPKPLKPRVSKVSQSIDGPGEAHQFWGQLEDENHQVFARTLPGMAPLDAQVPVHRIFFLERSGGPTSELHPLTASEALPRWLNQVMLSRSQTPLRSLSALESWAKAGKAHALCVGNNDT